MTEFIWFTVDGVVSLIHVVGVEIVLETMTSLPPALVPYA